MENYKQMKVSTENFDFSLRNLFFYNKNTRLLSNNFLMPM